MSGIEDRSSFAGSLADTEADRVRCQFEEDWKAGLAPRLEDYVNRVGKELQPALLKELLLIELSHCAQHRLWPQASDYLPRFPGQEEAVQSAFSTINTVQVDSHQTALNKAPVSIPVPDRSRWVWGNYEILGELGRGGMGIVYRARDCRTGQIVALKTIQGFSAPVLYRFKNEFRGLADVTHPNLVTFYELVNDDQGWYITMELVEGQDFLTYVRQGIPGPLPSDRIDRLRGALQQLAAGVIALHEAGRLHRDIKPRNVMVTPTGRVVLLDFGLSAELSEAGWHHSTEQAVLGTVPYMSPEQAATQAVSAATDWYSVGVMLYEALTGQLPFSGSLLTVLRDKQERDPARPSTLATGIPPDLEQLCMQLLARQSEDRLDDAEIMNRLQLGSPDTLPGDERSTSKASLGLIGRERHLDVLCHAYDDMCRGGTVAVFVEGNSGVGKTAVVRSFLESVARQEGVIILAGRCYEQESMPYKAVDSLIDGLARHLTRLPATEVRAHLPRDILTLAKLFPVLRRVEAISAFPYVAEIPDPQETRRRAFVALRELLARLGDYSPLVLYIDDLQWGDLDSMELLTEMLRPPEAPRLLFIGSYRIEDVDTSAFLKAVNSARRRVDRSFDWRDLHVAPLSLEEAQLLASANLQHGSNPEQAEIIARESCGNPFFVQELARNVAAVGSPANSADMEGLTLNSVLWERYSRLDSKSQVFLGILSIAGRPLRQADVLAAAEMAPAESSSIRRLRVSRFIRTTSQGDGGRIETYHDRIRETITSRLPLDIYRKYHARLAEVLNQRGDSDADDLATHYEQSGDTVRAAESYLLAAQSAAKILAFDREAAFYGKALMLGHYSVDQERLLRVKLGDALANAGRGWNAAEQYLAAAKNTETSEAFEWLHKAAKQLLISGHIDDGIQSLKTVLASVNLALPASNNSALCSVLYNRLVIWWRGTRCLYRRPDEIAAYTLTLIDVCWSAALGLCLVEPVKSMAFNTLGLRLALKAGEPFRIARALSLEAGHQSVDGRRNQAAVDRLFQPAHELTAKINAPYTNAMYLLMRSAAEFLNGRFKNTGDTIAEAEHLLRTQCTEVSWELDTAHIFAMWSQTYLGDLGSLSERWPALLQEARARGNRFAVTYFSTYIMAMVRLSADDPETALSQLQEIMSQWSSTGYHVQHHNALLAHTLIHLYRDQPQTAWDFIQAQYPAYRSSMLNLIQHTRIDIVQLRARAALAAASLCSNKSHFLQQASADARRLESEGMPWSRAVARLIRAGLATSRSQCDQAVNLYREAATMLDEVDMRIYAAAARWRLGELVGGEAGGVLIEAANKHLTSEGVRHPEKMSKIFAPRCT